MAGNFGGPPARVGATRSSFPPAGMIHGPAVDKAPTRRFARKTSHGQFILNITARFADYDLFWALKGRLPPHRLPLHPRERSSCTMLPPKHVCNSNIMDSRDPLFRLCLPLARCVRVDVFLRVYGVDYAIVKLTELSRILEFVLRFRSNGST